MQSYIIMYTLFTDFFYYNDKDETELRACSNTFGEEKCESRKNYNLVDTNICILQVD
jgi:hypothetical protein